VRFEERKDGAMRERRSKSKIVVLMAEEQRIPQVLSTETIKIIDKKR